MATYDSRRVAFRHYRKKIFRYLFNTSTFIGNVLLALLLTYLIDIPDAAPQMYYVLFLLILAVGQLLTARTCYNKKTLESAEATFLWWLH